MKRSVEITTPFPSVEEVAKSLGMSKSRLRKIQQIVDGTVKQKRGGGSAKGRHRGATGQIKEKRDNTAAGTSHQ
jgi:hypothetical protein